MIQVFKGINKIFALSFGDNPVRERHIRYFFPRVEIKEYNVMIDGKNIFDQPIKNAMGTNDNNQEITAGQGDDYTTGCLTDYLYFKEYYKVIAVDLSKQQELDADSKAMQQVSFTGNLDQSRHITMLFILKEAKEAISDSLQVTVRVLIFFFFFFLFFFFLM